MEGVGKGRIIGGEGAGTEIGDLKFLQHRVRRVDALLCRVAVHGPVGQGRDAHFVFEEAGEDSGGRVIGRLQKKGTLLRENKLRAAGML